MNLKTRYPLIGLAALALPFGTHAQQATTPQEEVFELSPFEVNTSDLHNIRMIQKSAEPFRAFLFVLMPPCADASRRDKRALDS